MAKRDFRPKPLYRRVNTKARGVHHMFGGDYRHDRNTKAERQSEAKTKGMKQGVQRGLDYTPLFLFLLSRVGQPWAETYKEAQARLDKEDPIFWMVQREEDDDRAVVRVGESSYYSGLQIDPDGMLQFVDPNVSLEDLWPFCPCCTHTFNGLVFSNRFDPAQRTSFEKGLL